MKLDRTIVDVIAEEAPCLIPIVASVLPFSDLFSDDGQIGYDEDDRVFYALESDIPLPDEDGTLPDMHWSAGIYADHVEVLRLQKHGSVSRILGRETLTHEEFWGLLRRYGAVRSA